MKNYNGNLIITDKNINKYNEIETVSGSLDISAENAQLPALTTVSGSLDISAENAQLPALTTVSGSLDISAENAQLPALIEVGWLYIRAENAQLPALTDAGWLYISAENAQLPALTTVSGSLYICAENAQLPALTTVSGSLYISAENAQLPALTDAGYTGVTGNIDDMNLVGKYVFRGIEFKLDYIDGYTMVIDSEKTRGEFTIIKARYFGGNFSDLKSCYIAKRGKFTAHGDTVKSAIEDVNFKYLQEDFDAAALVSEISERQTVTINDYRLLTGACRSGVEHFLISHGIDFENTECLPLNEVLKITDGAFGGSRMTELFN